MAAAEYIPRYSDVGPIKLDAAKKESRMTILGFPLGETEIPNISFQNFRDIIPHKQKRRERSENRAQSAQGKGHSWKSRRRRHETRSATSPK